jgi:hypothetical protein
MGRAIQFAAVSSGVSSVKRGLASQEGFQDGSILPEFPFNCRRRKSVDGLRDVHGFVNLSVSFVASTQLLLVNYTPERQPSAASPRSAETAGHGHVQVQGLPCHAPAK